MTRESPSAAVPWLPRGRAWRLAVGYAVAAAAVFWVFRDVDARRVLQDLERLSWALVLLSLGLEVLSYGIHGLRWSCLLGNPTWTAISRAVRAIFSGLFVNEFIPLRPGELLRPWLVSRETGRPFAQVLPSVGAERLMDGAWLFALAVATAALTPLPGGLSRIVIVLGALVVPLGAALLLLVAWFGKRKQTGSADAPPPTGTRRLRERLTAFLVSAGAGVREIGLTGRFWAAFALSGAVLAVKVAALYTMVAAWRFPLDLPDVMLVFCILRLGTALPNTPANVGTHQVLVSYALVRLGIDPSSAAGFSGVSFVFATLLLTVLGAVTFARSGLFRALSPGPPPQEGNGP